MKKDVMSFAKIVYQKVMATLPPVAGAAISDVSFSLSHRPLVYRDPVQHPLLPGARGSVTFSIDFEMAWAYQYSGAHIDCVQLGMREREQVPGILGKFNEFGIPATWATVGHLFLDRCARGTNGLAHEHMPRCPHFDDLWKFTSGDWYQFDPCTDYYRDPAWYAPDLIERILSSRTKHEMACHGFSHVGFGPYCPETVSAAELDACIEVMKQYNLRPTSLVFPGNHVGRFQTIARKGFRSIRAFPVSWAEISLPVKLQHGLWWVPGSVGIDVESEAVVLEKRLARLQKYVARAMETGLNAHFWFHPSMPLLQLEKLLYPILSHCADLRDRGMLDIVTMDQLVDIMEQRTGAEKDIAQA